MPIKKLTDDTAYEKATHQTEKDLKGSWHLTYKIDGVRALRNKDNTVVSRASLPLYNLNHLEFKDAEIFRNNIATSVSLVMTQSHKLITQDDVYELRDGYIDPRLNTNKVLVNPKHETLMAYMEGAVKRGYEGIVLHRIGHPAKWIKYVPEKTADVRVTGFNMSDKRIGYIKNFETAHGKIGGTSFTIEELDYIKASGAKYFIGKIMEVAFREKTPADKMRFGKFTRWRFDKGEESFT